MQLRRFVSKFSMALSMALSSQVSEASFCGTYHPPKRYTEMKTKLEEKIKAFSGKKPIAGKADEILAKLIKAKSPVLMGWLNKRNLESKSDGETIREWRQYFAQNMVLTKYPQGDPTIDKEIEVLMDSVNQLFSDKKFQEKLERLFLKSKESSVAAIKTMPIKEDQRKKIIARIESIHLYWMKDFATSKFKKTPLEFLDWGIAYDPVANEINIGVNSLAYPNDETYLAVFAHEIGHAFDSCRWVAFFEGEWPFQKIGECLRSPESVQAKKRDDSKLELLAKENKDLATSLKINPTCNKLGYPPAGLQADQLPESFADWFSAEAIASTKEMKLSDLRIDLCEKKELMEGSSYPANEIRLKGIYFAQPQIKAGNADFKSNSYRYCGWKDTH